MKVTFSGGRKKELREGPPGSRARPRGIRLQSPALIARSPVDLSVVPRRIIAKLVAGMPLARSSLAANRVQRPHMKNTSGPAVEQRAPPRRHRVLVIDDHPVTRLGVSTLIGGQRDLAVCGEAGSPNAAIELVPKLEPDLAIVDLAHGTMGGIELIRNIRALRPQMRIWSLRSAGCSPTLDCAFPFSANFDWL